LEVLPFYGRDGRGTKEKGVEYPVEGTRVRRHENRGIGMTKLLYIDRSELGLSDDAVEAEGGGGVGVAPGDGEIGWRVGGCDAGPVAEVGTVFDPGGAIQRIEGEGGKVVLERGADETKPGGE